MIRIKLWENFCIIQNQLNFHSKLYLTWQYALDQPKTNVASLGKLGCGWSELTTPNQKYNLTIWNYWGQCLGKKSKMLIDSLRDIDDQKIL